MHPNDPNWHSPVEAARVVDDAGEIEWDAEADFVVVGYGIAGAAAAVEARERGLDVLVVDRSTGGGASAMSGGVLYAGGGTRIQREAGVEDSPQNMFAYLELETQGCVSDDTLRAFCEQSAPTVEWLMAHGVEFRSTLYDKKTSYPWIDYFLYHSDNSLVPSYAKIARPAARGHRGAGRITRQQMMTATNLGGSLVWPLQDWAGEHGVRFMPFSEARQLVVDRDGSVLGVRLLELPAGDAREEFNARMNRGRRLQAMWPPILPGSSFFMRRAIKHFKRAGAIEATRRVSRFIRARRGVCLSAGGFVFNRRMMQTYAPRYLPGYPLGTPGDDGSGIRLGQSAGGAVDRMDRVTAWRFINPPLAWARGMAVNQRGERFCNEMAYGATLGIEIADHQDGRAWLILDRKLVRQAWNEVKPGKTLPFQRDLARLNMLLGRKKARTLPELARKIGVEASRLTAAVEEYSRAARGEVADLHGKTREDCAVLDTGPFTAIDIGIGATLLPCPTLTLGGLVVNEKTGNVRRDDGTDIDGLYAAGRTAIGVSSNLYVSGLSLADGVFSGRRAGRNAAEHGQLSHREETTASSR